MRNICWLLIVLMGLSLTAVNAGAESGLPAGTKLPPQPREVMAPATEIVVATAPARFGGDWTRGKDLPVALAGHSVLASGSSVILMGGVGGREHYGLRDVYVATAGKSGLGSWTKTSPLPAPAAFGAAVVSGKRVYYIGGASREGIDHIYRTVWSAEVRDGKPGKWREETPLPGVVMHHAAAVFGGCIYVLGGFDGQSYSGKVLYTRVNADGTLADWKETTAKYPYPVGRTILLPVRSGLVVCGGLNSDSQGEHISAMILRAKCGPDGDIREWVSDNGIKMASRSMNYSVCEHAGTYDDNFIYSAGGRDVGSLGVPTVQASWIDPEGRITAWQTGPDMPAWDLKGPRQGVKLYYSAAVVANDRFYVLGGFQSIREATKMTWSMGLKPYQEPEWVKKAREKAEKK